MACLVQGFDVFNGAPCKVGTHISVRGKISINRYKAS